MAVTESKCYLDNDNTYHISNCSLNIPAIEVNYDAWYLKRTFKEKHYIDGQLAYEMDGYPNFSHYYIILNTDKSFSSLKTNYKCYNNKNYKFYEIDESIYIKY